MVSCISGYYQSLIENHQEGGPDEEGEEEEEEGRTGEEDPIVSEPHADQATTALLGPGYAHYIPQREWLSREAQVYHVPSRVPGKFDEKCVLREPWKQGNIIIMLNFV